MQPSLFDSPPSPPFGRRGRPKRLNPRGFLLQTRGLDRMETDIEQETSLVSLHETVKRAGSMVTRLADDLATAKAVLADSFLTLGKLNRSQDDLDAIELKSSTSG